MSRKFTYLFTTLVLALALLFANAGPGHHVDQSSVVAQSCGSGTPCPTPVGGAPTTRLSTLNVTYEVDEMVVNPRKIEPDGTTSWLIEAKYLSTSGGTDCNCEDYDPEEGESLTGTFDITWSHASRTWVIANKNFLSPLIDVTVCSQKTCNVSPATTHSWGYTLLVTVREAMFKECEISGTRTYWLDQVLYETTAVTVGDVITGIGGVAVCAHSGTMSENNMSPVSQTFQTGDNGEWECSGSCPFGPSLLIQYSTS